MVNINMQLRLGLPSIDRTKTRQAVRKLFELYRHYKLLLEMDIEPHPEPTPPLPGYKNAMDPNLIRTPYSTGGGMRFETESMESKEDRDRRRFVESVERRVNRLPEYQRDIIRHHYMVGERPGEESRLPSDTQTYQHLRAKGWCVSERYYDEEKQKAIMTLAEAFGIAVRQE